MRLLVTGMYGMLGREVVRAGNAAGHRVLGSQRQSCDLGDWLQVFGLVRQAQPEVIINCAGINRPRPLPYHEYMRTNALAPHILAAAAEHFGARVVHMSTDCVFSGTMGDRHLSRVFPYNERDIPDATDIYGRSKAAGELLEPPHLTVRGSFVGIGERGLLAWLMAQQGTKVEGYLGARWNGVTAPMMARALVHLAEAGVMGIAHLCGEEMTKCDLLEMAIEAFELPVEVEPVEGPEDRRRNMTLTSTRDLGIIVPPMPELLQELRNLRDRDQAPPPEAPPMQIRPNIVLPNRAQRRAMERTKP